MQSNKGSEYFKNLIKDKTRLKRWRKMILCLSCVVVFCTVYALILPALTLERKTICGKEEHMHTEACYSTEGQLICEKEEHTYTETCYADTQTTNSQMEDNTEQNQNSEQNKAPDTNETDAVQDVENEAEAENVAETPTAQANEAIMMAAEPAAEGEGGTGSTTTATEGFDLSASAITSENKVKSVTLYYQKADGTWEEILTSGSKIPGNAKIKLSVAYEKIQIRNLIDTYNCTLTYDLPELFRNVTTINGAIMEGLEQVGTLSVSGEKIKVQFKKEYLENKIKLGTTTIEGDFYILGDVNLSKVNQTTGETTLQTAGKDYTLDFGPDAIAQYGNVSVQKKCTSEKAISTPNGNFLPYTITVTAGETVRKLG